MLTHPSYFKYRKINRANKVIESKLLDCIGMLSLLKQIGYSELDFNTLEFESKNFESVGYARELIGNLLGIDKLDFNIHITWKWLWETY